jgi:hypothetical protein
MESSLLTLLKKKFFGINHCTLHLKVVCGHVQYCDHDQFCNYYWTWPHNTFKWRVLCKQFQQMFFFFFITKFWNDSSFCIIQMKLFTWKWYLIMFNSATTGKCHIHVRDAKWVIPKHILSFHDVFNEQSIIQNNSIIFLLIKSLCPNSAFLSHFYCPDLLTTKPSRSPLQNC